MQSDNLIDFDLSMTKQFSLGADRSLEFRAEFFNHSNWPTFGLPSTNFDQSSG